MHDVLLGPKERDRDRSARRRDHHLVQATWGTLNLQAIRGFRGFYGLVSRDDGERVASASFYSDKGAASAAKAVIDV